MLRPTRPFAEGQDAVVAALEGGRFDLAIFAQLPGDPSESDGLRPVERAALEHLPRQSLVLVDAHDHMPQTLFDWARRVGTAFKYNLADACPAAASEAGLEK